MVWEVRPEGVYDSEGFGFIFEVGRWESGRVGVLDNGRHGRLEILVGGAGSVVRFSSAVFYNLSGFLDSDLFARPLFFRAHTRRACRAFTGREGREGRCWGREERWCCEQRYVSAESEGKCARTSFGGSSTRRRGARHMALTGKAAEKDVGMWLGPSAAAGL
jgi:hypothetical protein